MTAARALRRIEALRLRYDPRMAVEKRALLALLKGARFGRADLLLRYHEALCFMAAYPDDARLLALVRRELAAFAHRPELARFGDELADSGVAGSATRYNYFWMMSRWLAERFPRRLALDWSRPEFVGRLGAALPLLLGWTEAEAVRRSPLDLRAILDGLRGAESDAVFVLRRIAQLPGDDRTREHFHDAIDSAYVLAPAPGFPSRTLARHAAAPLVFRNVAPPAARPDLVAELKRRPPGVRRVSGAEARSLLELAREAMLTRARDLVAFSWGNQRDVMLVDDGDGVAFAIIGSLPAHRLPLPVVHGWIMLRNRVPVGYVQTDTLLASSEISFNVFATFRGTEAGYLFARVLAVTHHVFGARAFSIEPYQLGVGNSEGIESGAWWFYYKLGFRPVAAGPQAILARELARMRGNPTHRSGVATLKRLACGHMVFEPEAGRRAWLPLIPGLGLARRWESPVDAGMAAIRRFDARNMAGWTTDERSAWQRLAPILLALEGVERWTADQRRAAVVVWRAKGGIRESAMLSRLDAHAPLSAALTRMLDATIERPDEAARMKQLGSKAER